MRRDVRHQQGGVLVIVVISLVALLGIAALAIDTGDHRAHRRQLQSAADAGALAAAAQLPPLGSGAGVCGAGSQSDVFIRQNSKLTSPRNLVDNGQLDTSYCEIIGNSVRVWPQEADVPYIFGQVLGFVNDDISARARARIVYLTTARGLMPLGIEDMRPKTIELIVDSTGQSVTIANKGSAQGCFGNTVENFPFWCGGGSISNALPAGGSTLSLRVTDMSNQVITWTGIGYIGTDRPLTGCNGAAGGTCTLKDVWVNPVTDPFAYYVGTDVAHNYSVTVRLTNPPANAQVRVTVGNKTVNATLVDVAQGLWATPANNTFSAPTTAGAQDVNITVGSGNGNNAPSWGPVRGTRVYAHDLGDGLQQYAQSTHYVPAGGSAAQRTVTFNLAFRVLVKGREIVLKLGAGGAFGNSGNFGSLDLDTNSSWGQYQCYPGGTPNLREEVEHGSCTPYSLGQDVVTQTGNAAGQIDQGLDDRIDGSAAVTPFNVNAPPPSGDPRWINLILVPPVVFANCNGNCTTTVTGFGNFYISEYSGDPGSHLKNGEVRGVFWDRVNPAGPYSTTCTDPSGICMASLALMPWDG